jgi:phosphohistidine phosphatase
MAIYLVQHGKSLPKEADPEKGLTEEGRAEVQRIAEVAKAYQVQVRRIVHSGKKRAFQTADIFAGALNPPEGIHAVDGIDPLDDVTRFAGRLDFASNQMLVGHLPFMERLISYLITGSIDTPVFKLQNGGILCLSKDPGKAAVVIKWALMPHIG